MRSTLYLVVILFFNSLRCYTQIIKEYESENLKIEQINSSTYIHISYIELENGYKLPCNGILFISNDELLVFDTPVSEKATQELIDHIGEYPQIEIKGVVVNHFHNDCLAGLQKFHNLGITSYANYRTIGACRRDKLPIPKNGFDKKQEISMGKDIVINYYFGKGHTEDNIVSYIQNEQILFGGCLIKEIGAGKGNLEDASIYDWPKTVSKIIEQLEQVKTVVPGHGNYGSKELLDYTRNLFQ